MTAEEKRIQRINNFIESNPTFIDDFPVMTQAEILPKYNIAYSFYKVLESYFHLEKNEEVLAQKKSQRLSEAMQNGGLDKIRQTCLERYGVTSYVQVEGVQAKASAAGNSEEGRKKAKETCLEKYGVTTPLQKEENWRKGQAVAHTPETLEKIRAKRMAKYGVPYSLPAVIATVTPEVQEKRRRTTTERYGSLFTGNHEKALQTIKEKYGVNCSYFVNETAPARISKTNKDFAQKLIDLGVEVQLDRRVYDNHPFDIIAGKYLIELNPTVSHSYMFSFQKLTGKGKDVTIPKDYHFNHWLQSKQHGYEQLSLFDWMDKDKFFDLLISKLGVNQTRCGARNFKVIEVSKKEANEFLDINHVLGACNGNKINLALAKDGVLYAIMTFGTPRFNKNYDYELLRFATLKGYSIAGGASKLFKHFITSYPRAKIITYSDNNLGNGSVYSLLGFKELAQCDLSIVWDNLYIKHSIRHVSLVAPPPQGQGADRLIGGRLKEKYFYVGRDREDFIRRGGKEEYAKEYELHKDEPDWWPGNIDIALHYHYVPVVDCGSTIWEYVPEVVL